MGICTNQFDIIDNRFFNQRIKTLRVICSEQAQAADAFIANDAVRASLINTMTGEIDPGRQLVATILSATGSVTVDKVFDSFNVQLAVIDIATGELVDDAIQVVTVNGFTDCPGALPGDCLQKHDIQVAPPTFSVGPAPDFVVTLFVSVEDCIIVARETILKVNAAEVFCR